MTTEDGPTSPGGRVRDVTTLPGRGTVLVRSAGPPRVSADRCVDVRPGPFATFDGDRHWMSLFVRDGGGRRRFDRSELSEVEDAVVAALREGGPVDASDRITSEERPGSVGGDDRAILRFGDRAACRRMLPTAAVDAIERRLGVAASRGSAPLLTWTTGDLRHDDDRSYDVVLDPPPDRPD